MSMNGESLEEDMNEMSYVVDTVIGLQQTISKSCRLRLVKKNSTKNKSSHFLDSFKGLSSAMYFILVLPLLLINLKCLKLFNRKAIDKQISHVMQSLKNGHQM